MTATTAIPDAVLIGLHLSFGSSACRWECGIAARISVRRGCDLRPYLNAAWYKRGAGAVDFRIEKRHIISGSVDQIDFQVRVGAQL